MTEQPSAVDEDDAAFALCDDITEALVLLHSEHGLDGVELLLKQGMATRENLTKAADTVGAVGMKALAALIRQYAKKAKRGPPTFEEKWRTRERAAGILPGHQRHRYKP